MIVSHPWRQARVVVFCGDILTVAATYVLADYLRTVFWLRKPWPEVLPGFDSPFEVHYWSLVVLPILWPAILSALGWYDRDDRLRGRQVEKALGASFLLVLMLAGMALFFRRDAFPRMQIVVFAALLPATALVSRRTTGWIGQWLTSRTRRHVLIVGTGRDAVRLRRLLRSGSHGRSAVLGHLTMPEDAEPIPTATGAILGDVGELATLLNESVIDEVFFALPIERLAAALPYVRVCEEVGVTAHVMASSAICRSTPVVDDVQGLPLLSYAPARHAPELLFIKRLIDIGLSAVGLALASPFLFALAVAIGATSPGPILFRQRRSGLNGRQFWLFKFRTMTADAESRRADLEHLNESAGPVFKISNDPRVTRLGAFMRRYSLDELPQLLNVLRGDMSIVGPRPPIPEEVARYDRWQRRRLSMRPGITCLWQVKGRHRIPFDQWMALDLDYIDHWSLKLDFLIMLKTAGSVLAGSGV